MTRSGSARALRRRILMVLAVLCVVAAVVVWRTSIGPRTASTSPTPTKYVISVPAEAVERFAGAIRIATVSRPSQPPDVDAMKQLHAYLAQSFPLVHTTLQRELVGTSSLLYTWPGTEPNLPPVLLLGHLDVVPIDPASLAMWTHPPFSGEVADGFIWGRGSMDDKQTVLSILEASEALLHGGFRPRRTLLFAFGDDEENDGHGAEALVKLLSSRGVHPTFVMDEGGQIARGTLPGVRGDVALISIAEKGIVSVRLTVHAPGGHSSRPPPHTAVGIMSHAIAALEQHQMPTHLNGVTASMLDSLASRMSFEQRMMVRNRWLFGPLLARSLERTASGSALLRTTTAATMFNSGIKDNVLPTEAIAVVNFRILPGDTVATVLQHVRDTIDDPRIEVTIYGDLSADPSPVSPINTASFHILEATVQQFFPQAITVPNLLVARTDSARYYAITPNVYKFFPAVRDEDDAERVHGLNERLSIETYRQAVQFMATLLQAESAG